MKTYLAAAFVTCFATSLGGCAMEEDEVALDEVALDEAALDDPESALMSSEEPPVVVDLDMLAAEDGLERFEAMYPGCTWTAQTPYPSDHLGVANLNVSCDQQRNFIMNIALYRSNTATGPLTMRCAKYNQHGFGYSDSIQCTAPNPAGTQRWQSRTWDLIDDEDQEKNSRLVSF